MKKKLNLALSQEAYEQLEKLAEVSSRNKAKGLDIGLIRYQVAEAGREKEHQPTTVAKEPTKRLTPPEIG